MTVEHKPLNVGLFGLSIFSILSNFGGSESVIININILEYYEGLFQPSLALNRIASKIFIYDKMLIYSCEKASCEIYKAVDTTDDIEGETQYVLLIINF